MVVRESCLIAASALAVLGLGHAVGVGRRRRTPAPGEEVDPCARCATRPVPKDCRNVGEDCSSSRCCVHGMKCYEKDKYWSSCRVSCTPGLDPNDAPDTATPWSCKLLVPLPPPETRRRRQPMAPYSARRRRQPPVPPAPAGSPVANHGHLRVDGNKIVDQSDRPVRLRGVSLFWSQWMPQYYNEDALVWLKDDWRISLVRAAMGVEKGGYLTKFRSCKGVPRTCTDASREPPRVEAVVDAAIKHGLYVIIDWHDHNAEKHVKEAQAFFDEMAKKYGRYPNVLFETFNEPEKQDWTADIKPYHEDVVPVIRRHTDSLIILGTRSWSQEVDVASKDPVPGENLAYTIHFYASSHKAELRKRAVDALTNGVPLFATEWGTCGYSGDGALDLEEVRTWLAFLEKHFISDANWAISDKKEGCSALLRGASGKGGWTAEQLTPSGRFVRESLRAPAPGPAPAVAMRRRRSEGPRPAAARRRRSDEGPAPAPAPTPGPAPVPGPGPDAARRRRSGKGPGPGPLAARRRRSATARRRRRGIMRRRRRRRRGSRRRSR